MTVGEDRLDYDGNPSFSLLNTKIFLNSVIYDAYTGARYGTVDVKDFYLNNPMNRYQYMKIAQQYFTDEIRSEYDIDKLVHNGYLFVEIRKGMYGLNEFGITTFSRIINNLVSAGYYLVKHTPSFCTYKTRNLIFTLAIDDFGVKYSNMGNIHHLLK